MGLVCARRLLEPGGVLVVADRSPTVEDTAVELGRHGPPGTQVRAVRCDVTNRADVGALAEEVADLGELAALVHAALVHAAGVSPTMGDWQAMFTVDLVGTVLVVDAFRPLATSSTAAVCFASSAAP
jgi:NAD(P)-dependent dehydrogenase (short-subunit alcohol dehydrogenase family)